MADEIKMYLLSLLPGEKKLYLNSNKIYRISTDAACNDVLYLVEFINFFKFNDTPHHEFRLKKDVPIMLYGI